MAEGLTVNAVYPSCHANRRSKFTFTQFVESFFRSRRASARQWTALLQQGSPREQARKPATSIPSSVTVRLVPSDFQEKPEEKLYRLGREAYVTVLVVNNSDKRVKVEVIDLYYGNRLQLFKDGLLVPYKEETAKLIQSKDESPRLVDVTSNLILDPPMASGLQNRNLKDWYGPLTPGVYRLIDRRRFEINGPWTADSAELLFEVVP